MQNIYTGEIIFTEAQLKKWSKRKFTKSLSAQVEWKIRHLEQFCAQIVMALIDFILYDKLLLTSAAMLIRDVLCNLESFSGGTAPVQGALECGDSLWLPRLAGAGSWIANGAHKPADGRFSWPLHSETWPVSDLPDIINSCLKTWYSILSPSTLNVGECELSTRYIIFLPHSFGQWCPPKS